MQQCLTSLKFCKLFAYDINCETVKIEMKKVFSKKNLKVKAKHVTSEFFESFSFIKIDNKYKNHAFFT